MTEERTLESQLLYKGRLVNLRLDTVELPSGRQAKREIVEHRGAVAIVALDAAGQALLVRQYRKATERTLLEIPAGTLDPGEEPGDCAQRELQEETGYRAGKMERIGGFYTSPGFCTEFIHLFLATGLESSPLPADADEAIELLRLPITDAPKLITSGEICDAKTIAGLLTVLALRPEHRNQPEGGGDKQGARGIKG